MRILKINARARAVLPVNTMTAVSPDHREAVGLCVFLNDVTDVSILHARFNCAYETRRHTSYVVSMTIMFIHVHRYSMKFYFSFTYLMLWLSASIRASF